MIKLPADYNGIAEQLIRPTGLIDPLLYLRPSEAVKKEVLAKSLKERKLNELAKELEAYDVSNQIDDLLKEIRKTVAKGQRVLVTTLTKRMAEDLTSYLQELGIKVQYLHSEIDTVERVDILRDLRLGTHDVVVGINLLREGLDLPEVSLVAILDADKEGFLRSTTSLLQTIGRAARHQEGRVVLYADRITDSMTNAINETERRRKLQQDYNKKHGITPRTIKKDIRDQLIRNETEEESEKGLPGSLEKQVQKYPTLKPKEKREVIKELEIQMSMYADMLEFEKAAEVRDLIDKLKK